MHVMLETFPLVRVEHAVSVQLKTYMAQHLFAVLLGGRPRDATIEQHNMFFGVGESLEALYPAIKQFWKSAPKIHVDAYMILDHIGEYEIMPIKKETVSAAASEDSGDQKLFFVNLGGYREGVFDELHKKLFIVAPDESAAKAEAKTNPFYGEGIQRGKAGPHVDDIELLDDLEHHAPIEVNTLLASEGYAIQLKKSELGTSTYPQPVITGYQKIP